MTNEFDILREGRRPPGSIPANDYTAALQGGGRLLESPSLEDINSEFASPGVALINYVDIIAEGGKPAKQVEKELLARAGSGDMNQLLDVINASLIIMTGIRYPTALGINKEVFKPKIAPTAAFRNMRDFVTGMFRSLSRDSVSYEIDFDQISTRAKMGLSLKLFHAMKANFPEQDIKSLPQGFHEFSNTLPGMVNTQGHSKWRFSFSPELTQSDLHILNTFIGAKKEGWKGHSTEELKSLFTTIVKAYGNYHRRPRAIAYEGVNLMFNEGIEDEITAGLSLLSSCLQSPDKVISNRAVYILTEAGLENPIDGTHVFLQWPKAVQPLLRRMINGESVSDNFRKVFNELIQSMNERGQLNNMVNLLLIDYPAAEERIEHMLHNAYELNVDMVYGLTQREHADPSLELLARAIREGQVNAISRRALLELFDDKRPLGFFLDNLKNRWQDLQTLTREQMWPGFITSKRAALWPSERELDILQFTGRHPASILGFSGIQFYTRGFTPPEVGLEFTFKTSDRKLRGRLREGQLTDLPFGLEDTHPFIYAFLEHIAVGSFQELVTIASRRIGVAREGKRQRVMDESGQQERVVKQYMPFLPRRETSYIRVSEHQPEELTSDQVIEEARKRERLPIAIPQRVIPLKYAVRYRFYRAEVEAARARGASPEEIRALEGQAIQNLSQIPNPSASKLDNLPPEFALEALETPDGYIKYLDTWRVEHVRPKPKEGEEYDLSAIYERRFKAAPIALTRHLETWFTQPPTT